MPPDKDKDIAERVAVLESKMGIVQSTLARIEAKLDRVIDDHDHRITKLEAEFGFFKKVGTALWSIIYAAIIGTLGWIIKKQ